MSANQALSKKQQQFVELVAGGHNPTKACRSIGYSYPHVDASRLMRNSRVLSALRAKRTMLIDGDMTSIALDTMKELMLDKDSTPAATRYKAAEWTLKAGGYGAKEDDSKQHKELTEMNADELAAAVSSGMQALGELAQSLQGHHIIDGSPRQLIEVGEDDEDDPDNGGQDDDFLG